MCTNTSITPLNREAIFATTAANVCAGIPFTDTGGTTKNYTNSETWARTVTPYISGLKLKVTFLSFNIEDGYDYLYIYNGPNKSYPDLTDGGITGNFIPGP